jgi:hypothetical protein
MISRKASRWKLGTARSFERQAAEDRLTRGTRARSRYREGFSVLIILKPTFSETLTSIQINPKPVMKTALLSISLLICVSVNGQQYLTNAEVYNFEVGDVMQSRHEVRHPWWGGSEPPTFETRTILRKAYSAANDTLRYTVKRHFYTLPGCETCQAKVSSDTIIQIITDLQGIPDHGNQTTCYPTADTVYVDICGRTVWERYPINIPCFESIGHTTWFIEGLGGPYFNFYDHAIPLITSNGLSYYKKSSDSCGQYVSGVNSLPQRITAISIFPNPAHDFVNVKGAGNIQSYYILDITGKQVLAGAPVDNKINVAILKQGMYFVRIKSNEGVGLAKLVKE